MAKKKTRKKSAGTNKVGRKPTPGGEMARWAGVKTQTVSAWRRMGAPVPRTGAASPLALYLWLRFLAPSKVTTDPDRPTDPNARLVIPVFESLVDRMAPSDVGTSELVNHGRTQDWREEGLRQETLRVHDQRKQIQQETMTRAGKLITIEQQQEREERRDSLVAEILTDADSILQGTGLTTKDRKKIHAAIVKWRTDATTKLADPDYGIDDDDQ